MNEAKILEFKESTDDKKWNVKYSTKPINDMGVYKCIQILSQGIDIFPYRNTPGFEINANTSKHLQTHELYYIKYDSLNNQTTTKQIDVSYFSE